VQVLPATFFKAERMSVVAKVALQGMQVEKGVATPHEVREPDTQKQPASPVQVVIEFPLQG